MNVKARTAKIQIGDKTYRAEVSSSLFEKARGLSGRIKLEKGRGMLFTWPRAVTPTFHMRGMKFPIDIIWISPDLKIVGIEKDAQPWKGLIGRLYSPKQPIKYVLEVNAGSGIKAGDAVDLR